MFYLVNSSGHRHSEKGVSDDVGFWTLWTIYFMFWRLWDITKTNVSWENGNCSDYIN